MPSKGNPRVEVRLDPEYQAKVEGVRAMLSPLRPDFVPTSEVVRYLIDAGYEAIMAAKVRKGDAK